MAIESEIFPRSITKVCCRTRKSNSRHLALESDTCHKLCEVAQMGQNSNITGFPIPVQLSKTGLCQIFFFSAGFQNHFFFLYHSCSFKVLCKQANSESSGEHVHMRSVTKTKDQSHRSSNRVQYSSMRIHGITLLRYAEHLLCVLFPKRPVFFFFCFQ